MKKATIFLFVLYAIVAKTNAQTTYDVFTYTEPKGYKKEVKTDFISYTKADSKTGTYCIISLYAQNPSTGDLVKDFDNDWATLVKPLGVTAAPQKDNSDDITGWKTYSGAANFEFGGGTSMVLLTTAKKDNANIAILIVTNAQAMLKDADLFLDKLKLSKPIVKTTEVENTNVNLKASSVIGEWYLSDGNAKITLLFGANGQYDQGSLVDRRIISNLYETTTIKGKGTYSINGNTLTLTSASGSKEVYQIRFSTDTDSDGKPERILHLKRPIDGGQLYESDYYFVTKTSTAAPTGNNVTKNTSNELFNNNGISGVWVSYANLSAGLGSLTWNWVVFFSNGKSLSNLPNGGFANLVGGEYFDKTKNNVNSFSIGNYTFSNNKGSNIKAGAKYDDKLVLEKPNQLKIDAYTYNKCVPVNGQKLNGSFTTFANPADPAINQTNGFRSVITFTADGKFNDEGVYQVLLRDYGKDDAYNAPGKGSYELKDYSIILKFDDGRMKQEAFSMPFSYTTSNATIIFISRAQLNKMR